MIEINRIVADLNEMKKRLTLYIQPVNTDTLSSFLHGLQRCFLLSFDSSELWLRFNEFVDARQESTRNRGWKALSVSPDYEMREKGMPEEDIIQELIEIDIGKWRIWEKLEKEK